MMKFTVLVLLTVCVFGTNAEICDPAKNGTECIGTSCKASLDQNFVHVQCVSKHCTCSTDQKPCLAIGDCSTARCYDSNGDRSNYHCLDGYCKCIRT